MSQTLNRELRLKLREVVRNHHEVWLLLSQKNFHEEFVDQLADAALEVAGIAKRAKVDLSRAGIEWAIAAGENVTQEQLDRIQAEQTLLQEYERAMSYPPLPWDSPKLDRLRRFLITKPVDEIRKFGQWSKRPYSTFDPSKARSWPEQVKDNWLLAQEWQPEVKRGNGRGIDPVDQAFAELAAERAAHGNA